MIDTLDTMIIKRCIQKKKSCKLMAKISIYSTFFYSTLSAISVGATGSTTSTGQPGVDSLSAPQDGIGALCPPRASTVDT